MPFQRSIGYVGCAKQTAKDSAAAAATYVHGVTGGGIASATINQNPDDVTTANRYRGDMYRESVEVGVTIDSRAYLGSLGLYLYAALGAKAVTGAGDPYSHAFSTGGTLPYLTMFGSMGPSDALLTKVTNVKCSELTLGWDGSSPLAMSFSGLGTTIDPTGGAFTGGATDERDGDPFFIPVGGTFQFDAVGGTPANALIRSGSITIANNVEPIPSAATITPGDVFEGRQDVTYELTVIPDNVNDWIEILTGTTSGSAPSGDVQYGSVNLVFEEFGSGTHTLTVVSHKVAWACDLPTLDPNGGPAELELSGVAVYNTTESDVVDVTLTNAVASY